MVTRPVLLFFGNWTAAPGKVLPCQRRAFEVDQGAACVRQPLGLPRRPQQQMSVEQQPHTPTPKGCSRTAKPGRSRRRGREWGRAAAPTRRRGERGGDGCNINGRRRGEGRRGFLERAASGLTPRPRSVASPSRCRGMMPGMADQSDLFGGGPAQGSLFGEGENRLQPPAQSYLPDPEKVRRRLNALLETARAAERMPWPERDARMWQMVFPNMANWLPADEAAQLRLEFAHEMARLRQAAPRPPSPAGCCVSEEPQ